MTIATLLDKDKKILDKDWLITLTSKTTKKKKIRSKMEVNFNYIILKIANKEKIIWENFKISY